MVNKQSRVTAVFAALADPTRRRILVRLSERGESPVTALAEPFRISPPGFSKHLRVLEKAQLIQRHRKGRLHLIRARAAGMKEAQIWMAQCAAFWDSKFDALDELLRSEAQKDKSDEIRPQNRRQSHANHARV
jgi:DNA-binding transcriptional ArsR family regulator